MKAFCLFTIALLIACACADMDGRAGGKSVLVIIQDSNMKTTYSTFFSDLMDQGYALTYANADDKKVSLMKYGEYIYDHVIILAPKSSSPAGLSLQDILKIMDDGVNVVVGINSNAANIYRQLCQEVGIELSNKESVVIDHFNYLKPGNDHTKILTDVYHHNNNIILGNNLKGSILFHGIGMKMSVDNYLTIPILKAKNTAYSGKLGDIVEKNPQVSGSNVVLVGSVQARNNARLTIFGSIDMFSNTYYSTPKVINQQFTKSLLQWTFHQQGVLRMRDIIHHKSDGSLPETQLHRPPKSNLPETMYPEPEVAPDSLVYRIKDEIVYSTIIEEYKDGKWVPYKADDVQLEFVMLNPYLRHNLKHDDKGNYSTVFTAPDVYGIYKFHLMYRRQGYTVLESDTQVSLRPFRHNEYERFILTAYPYYVSVFTMMAGFFVFGFVYLYN